MVHPLGDFEHLKELKYTINVRAEADNAKTQIVPAIRNFLLVLPDKINDEYRKELSVQKIIDDIKTVEKGYIDRSLQFS